MKKIFADRLISFLLLFSCAFLPCLVRPYSVNARVERNFSSALAQHDIIVSREGEQTVRFSARRGVRYVQKSFFGANEALVQQGFTPFLACLFSKALSVEKKFQNKFLTTLQFLQTLF